jgi:6,7-dimethyl-8-ribityllumazine synthase
MIEKIKIHSEDLYPHPSSLDEDIYSSLCDLSESKTIIISTSYHKEITGSMAYSFIKHSYDPPSIMESYIGDIGFIEAPGAFEVPLVAKLIIEKFRPKQILALGCIVKGDTKHNEYLSSTVINGLRNLSLEYKIPVINGILTTDTIQQAINRAGTKYDKGRDFADSSVSMHKIIKKINDE